MNLQKIALVITLILLPMTHSAGIAADTSPQSYWHKHALEKTLEVDHRTWQQFLDKFLTASKDNITLVKYSAVDKKSQRQLDNYISELQLIPVSRLTKEQQLAYWINLYNAGTVQLILQNLPVKSIRDINFSSDATNGPWKEKLFKVEGQLLSLDDIEHEILRPIWQDARIHYALNCASLGCPDLQSKAFTPSNSEQLLDSAARRYINHPRGARVDNNKLIVSSLYQWFKSDFGNSDETIIGHLRKYADAELAVRLAEIKKIGGYEYSWALNGT